jgi:hypothetical protein
MITIALGIIVAYLALRILGIIISLFYCWWE